MKYPAADLFEDSEQEQPIEYFILKTLDKIAEGEKIHLIDLENADEVKAFIDSIPAAAFVKIQEFWAAIPRLKYEIKYTNAAGNERTIPLNTLEDFFTF